MHTCTHANRALSGKNEKEDKKRDSLIVQAARMQPPPPSSSSSGAGKLAGVVAAYALHTVWSPTEVVDINAASNSVVCCDVQCSD